MNPTPERVMEILSYFPKRQGNGLFAPGAERTIAEVLTVLLNEFGIGSFYSVGQNLSKFGLPAELPIRALVQHQNDQEKK